MSEPDSIPLSVPNIGEYETRLVSDAVKGTWVSSAGPDIKSFEDEFASYLGVRHACACQSGTAALHLCLRHFCVGPGDIVLVPALTFIATVNPVIYQGAEPIFFDSDDHLCVDVEQISRYLERDCYMEDGKTIDRSSGKTVKAIIPVHVFGECADVPRLMDIAEKYGLVVIEDAAESLGSKFETGQHSGTIGHAATFSFNGNKIITTGGGGMILARDNSALEHMRYLSQQAKDDQVYFINNEIGYNYRMTNMQAALGRAQLARLDDFIAAKRRNYRLYRELLSGTVYSILEFRNPETCNCWFYSLLTNSSDASIRDRLIKYLADVKIQSRPIWKLNNRQRPLTNGCEMCQLMHRAE